MLRCRLNPSDSDEKVSQLTVNLVLLFSYSVSNIWIVVYSYWDLECTLCFWGF